MPVILTIGFHQEYDPPLSRLREVLGRLKEFRGEDWKGVHITCADTEWSLGTDASGLVVWMNESYTVHGHGKPRHMRRVPRARVLALWELLAAGRIAEIEQEPWLSGDGSRA